MKKTMRTDEIRGVSWRQALLLAFFSFSSDSFSSSDSEPEAALLAFDSFSSSPRQALDSLSLDPGHP